MKKTIILILCIFITKDNFSQVNLSPWIGINAVKISYQNVSNTYNNIKLKNIESAYSFGTNVTIPIALRKSLFLGIGFSYIGNNVNFSLVSDVDGIDNNQSIIRWKHSYSQVAFPIFLTKAFYYDKNRKNNLSVSLGISLGINFENSAFFSAEVAKSEMNNDIVSFNTGPNLNENNIFMSSFICGIDIAPIKNLSNLKFGVSTSVNLKSNPGFTSYGSFTNHTKNIIQRGEVYAEPQFSNIIFSLKYDIKFKKKDQGKTRKIKEKKLKY